MTCPYCGLDMKQGFIQCDGRRKPAWFSSAENQTVRLTGFDIVSLLSTYKIEAFYCQPCKKIVIDTGHTS